MSDIYISDIDNMGYVYGLFYAYITIFEFFGDIKFYYQYEFDSQQSTYERLMNEDYITIAARSLEEANILNHILKCIIDEHTGYLDGILDDYSMKYNVSDDCIRIDQFFSHIMKSNTISSYKDYVTDKPKEITNNILSISDISIQINTVNIFDRDSILDILKDPYLRLSYKSKKYKKIFPDPIKRLQYIFSLLRSGG